MTPLSELTDGLFESVKGYIARNVGPLVERIIALEKREPVRGEKGLDGKDGAEGKPGIDGKEGAPGVDGKEGIPGPAGPAGEKGDKGDPGPQGEEGHQGPDGIAGKDGANGINGKDGADGINGKDADPIVIKAMLVEAAAAIHPVHGKDGRDGVDGRDGEAGRDAFAIDVLPAIETTKRYQRGTWAQHAGGLWQARGVTDGMTGWTCIVNGISEVNVSHEERGFNVKVAMSDGTKADHAFAIPVLLDKGIFKAGELYEQGDVTTWDGSMWIAQKATDDKPGTSDAWRLSVKRGRDGRDGIKGEKGDRGAEGRSGKDLTQLGFDGKKY